MEISKETPAPSRHDDDGKRDKENKACMYMPIPANGAPRIDRRVQQREKRQRSIAFQQLSNLLVETRWILTNLIVGGRALIRISKPICDPLDDLTEQFLWYSQVFSAVGVEERVSLVEKLGHVWSARGIALQAATERSFEAGRDADIADTEVGDFNLVVAVYNGEDTRHLVGDVCEGRAAVDHLVEDAA